MKRPASAAAARELDRGIGVALVVVFGTLFLLLRRHGLIAGDEGWLLHPVVRMLEGEVLYRDVLIYYAPLRYHALETTFAIVGPSLVVARTFLAALLLASVFGIYRVARRFSPPLVALLPAVIYGLAPGPWHKAPLGFCVVVFLLALARGLERPTALRIAVVGAVAGLGLVTRQDIGLVEIAMAGVVFPCEAVLRRSVPLASRVMRALREGSLVLAGASLVVVPVILGYASAGALGALVDGTVSQALFHSGIQIGSFLSDFVALISPTSLGTAQEGRGVGLTLVAWLAFLPVAAGFVLRTWWTAGSATRRWLGVALLGFALLAVRQSYVPPHLVRFLQVAIPFYLLVAFVLGSISGTAGRRATTLATAVLAGYVAGVLAGFPSIYPTDAYTGSVRALRYRTPLPVLGDEILVDEATASEVRRVREFFEEHTAPGEPVFAAPYLPLYYLLLERPNPTRFVGDATGGHIAVTRGKKESEARRLLASPTRHALVTREWWLTDHHSQPLLAAIVRNFSPVREVGGLVILERERQAPKGELAEIHRRLLRGIRNPADGPRLRRRIQRDPEAPLPRELLERWQGGAD